MPADELRQGFNYHVRAVFDRLQVHGCGDRVVDDEGHASTMGRLAQGFEVHDIECRVAHRLAEDGPSAYRR